jgi:hypothetical protein
MSFSYDSPDAHIGETETWSGNYEPARTGEQFLVRAVRSGAAVGALEGRRTTDYAYGWLLGQTPHVVSFYSSMMDRLQYYEMRDTPLAAMQEIEHARSAVVDNITQIKIDEHDGRGPRLNVLSEYDEVYNFTPGPGGVLSASSFDRVIRQVYGGATRLAEASDYSGNPASFRYAPQGDEIRFSPQAEQYLHDGGAIARYDGPIFGQQAGQAPVEIPNELLADYIGNSRSIFAVDAPCSEVGKGIIDYSLESTPVTEYENDFNVVRSLIDQAALQVCNWTRFVDRDQRLTWSGMNFMGLPLVTARQSEQGWVVTDRVYNGRGSLVEEYWPRSIGENASVRVQMDYVTARQWTMKEMRMDGLLRAKRVLPYESSSFIEGDELLPLDYIESLYAYDDMFSQLAHAERLVVSGGDQTLVHEMNSDFVCPPPAPSFVCAPGLVVCDRLESFREIMENIRFRVDLMVKNVTCVGGTCASELEVEFDTIKAQYVDALHELEMDYLGAGADQLLSMRS